MTPTMTFGGRALACRPTGCSLAAAVINGKIHAVSGSMARTITTPTRTRSMTQTQTDKPH